MVTLKIMPMAPTSMHADLFQILTWLLFIVRSIHAQSTTIVTSLSYATPTGYSTTSFDVSAATTYLPNTDFSNEMLNLLWDQVGPISTGPITTTVSPTAEPTAYPSPGVFHPLVPSYNTNLSGSTLPDNFIWGLASSSYQIEGAAKDEGKGPSIWDLLAHRVPNIVTDNSTGDVAAQHYYLYKQDFARLNSLGVPYFSPSISWPRIFPFGKGPVNAAALSHYDDVVAEMIKNGITPAITLFHWDTPLALFNEYGAWTDEQIVDDFFNYATFIISRDWQYSDYPAGQYYPAYNNITGGLPARIICSHYTLLAHAKVAKWYHKVFKGRGRITFKNSGNYFEPNSSSKADQIAVDRSYAFALGWFNNGPWTDGDYPSIVKDTLGDVLPSFTQAQKDMIKDSCDFFAIDGYTSYYAGGITGGVEACVANSSDPNFPECASTSSVDPSGFPIGPAADSGASWLYDTPAGIRKFLKTITSDLFPHVPDVVVSEFGFAEPFEGQLDTLSTILWDLRRSDYIQSFLDNILASKLQDGVNVTGVFGWAIFDNFEWFSGSSTKFGLQYVNYTSLERTPKASMFQFVDWFKKHGGAKL